MIEPDERETKQDERPAEDAPPTLGVNVSESVETDDKMGG